MLLKISIEWLAILMVKSVQKSKKSAANSGLAKFIYIILFILPFFGYFVLVPVCNATFLGEISPLILLVISIVASYLISRKLKEFKFGAAVAISIIGLFLAYIFLGGLGVFCGAQFSPCVAADGYLCQNPVYNHITGNIAVILGQNTGQNWATANFVFVPQGTPLSNGLPVGISFTSYPANITLSDHPNSSYGIEGLVSGQKLKILLPVEEVKLPVSVGTPETGAIWVQYTTQGNSKAQYAQIASINIRAS